MLSQPLATTRHVAEHGQEARCFCLAALPLQLWVGPYQGGPEGERLEVGTKDERDLGIIRAGGIGLRQRLLAFLTPARKERRWLARLLTRWERHQPSALTRRFALLQATPARSAVPFSLPVADPTLPG